MHVAIEQSQENPPPPRALTEKSRSKTIVLVLLAIETINSCDAGATYIGG